MVKLLRFVLAIVIANTMYLSASSQSLGVNSTGSPAATSAILDVSSTDKGMLVPRMSKTERNAIASPATGLMVFQNAPDSTGFYYYDGTVWLWLATNKSSTGWLTTGNPGTTAVNNFFGTTDNIPLSFRQNNNWLGRWNSATNNYFIGDSSGYSTTGGNNIAIGSKALFKNLSAYGNVAIGNNSLQNNTAGLRNVAVGDSALFTQSYNPGLFLSDNIALGSKAMFFNQPTSNTNGIKNTAIGNEAMYQNTTGYENTALGVSALRENTTGAFNTAIGRSAHRLSKSGLYNTYVGSYSGYSDSSGYTNTGLGSFAMYNHQKGADNVAIGANALGVDSTGKSNTAIGVYANYYSDTADFTVSVGYASLFYNKRDNNIAIGSYAGYSNSRSSTDNNQGVENTIMGYAALNGNAFGSQNTAIGYKAMAIFEPGTYSGTAPSRNVGIGDSALHQTRGNDNVGVGYKALSKITTNNNQYVAVGSRALTNATATYPNTAVGYSSQDSATTGAANTSLGSFSLTKNTIGYNNTAIGNAAMYEANNSTGLPYPAENTAVGNDALRYTRYYGHVAIGSGALRNDTSGAYNTGVGYVSLYSNLSGSYNAALGTSSLRSNLTGAGNTALGTNTMFNHKYNDYNTAIGFESMIYDSSGSLNTAIGWRSLRYQKNGSQNTAVGVGTLEFTDSSFANVAVGRGAMIGSFGNTTNLAYNTVMGFYAGAYMDSVEYATAIGMQAGYNNRGRENTFLGTNSGFGGSGTDLTGIENTGLGAYTLTFNNTGKSNTAVGLGALYANRTGNGNIGIGTRALANAANYSYNIAIGDSAMYGNNANENMAIGTFAMRFNNTGTNNTAVGNYSMQNNSTGSYSTALGHEALYNSNATGNTALGFVAGIGNTTGTYNSFVGYNANVSGSALTNATAIGTNAYVAQSNSMVLGSINGVNGGTATVTVGIGVNTPSARLHIRRNGASGGTFIANPSLIVEDNVQSFVQLSNPNNSENGILSGNAATSIRSGVVFAIDSSVYLRSGGNNTRMTISTEGYVGIGTTTPLTKLHVYESTAVNPSIRVASVSSAYEPGLELVKTGAGSDWKIRVDVGGILTYSWSGDDFASAPTDYYEMATTSLRPSLDITNTLGLSTRRWTAVYAQNGTIQTSDARDKENISNLSYGLNEIMKLRPISFNWKENPQWGKKLGFIAQEVQPILNEVVQVGELKSKTITRDDNGKEVNPGSDKLGIYYSDIIPVTVKAIQEQQVLIEKQAKENAELKAKNAQLEKDIQLIKQKLGINN